MQVVTTSESIVHEYLQTMTREINPSKDYIRCIRIILSKIDVMTATQETIAEFLSHLRKPDSEDPLHKWVGTYNLYVVILKRFFKWFNNPYCMEGFKQLKRKERSIYKPSDLWTEEDDLLFLKYCGNKRDKCYHAISISRGIACNISWFCGIIHGNRWEYTGTKLQQLSYRSTICLNKNLALWVLLLVL